MHRKRFLSSLAGSSLIPFLPPTVPRPARQLSAEKFTLPPYLKSGDTIGITCPAGFMSLQELQPAIALMSGWGFHIKIGSTVGKRDFTFGGTDAERLADLQQMLNDPEIQAIMCARGGYGAVHIIDQLDFSRFVQRPKWVVGFSDVTVLHAHILRHFRIATIHSKMCNSFPDSQTHLEPAQADSIQSIQLALTGKMIDYPVPPDPANKIGTGDGVLVGGNLKTIESLAGSASDLKTDYKILFVEDTGEYLYSIDRMFYNLKRTGKLENLTGLIIGGFKVKRDDAGDEFGRSLYNIVLDLVKEYSYPVCFNFPVGHQKANFALKCGVSHRLTVNARQVVFHEI